MDGDQIDTCTPRAELITSLERVEAQQQVVQEALGELAVMRAVYQNFRAEHAELIQERYYGDGGKQLIVNGSVMKLVEQPEETQPTGRVLVLEPTKAEDLRVISTHVDIPAFQPGIHEIDSFFADYEVNIIAKDASGDCYHVPTSSVSEILE